MDIVEDILSIDDLVRDPKTILHKLRDTRRPMVITIDGHPEAVLLSTDLMPSKKTAISAACELAGARSP